MLNTEEKNIILQNLEYINLNLENIPQFLKAYKDVDYKPTRAYEQLEFRVYKYINLKEIQILLTDTTRLDPISEKYSKAIPLCEFLDDTTEKNMINYAKFLNMLETVNTKEIEEIEKEQEVIKNKVPFQVKYNSNYLWEIYYSEFTGKYFMLVTMRDLNYSAFFYLLKKQIECFRNNTDELIFVPINFLDYTTRYMKKSEISDLEKYLWVFTNKWPNVYEVFDENNDLTLHITGYTNVYDKIKSAYKLEIENKEDAEKFFTLVKALFVLKTELPQYYKFETQINEKGELVFERNNKVILYNMLPTFIKDEYTKTAEELKNVFNEKVQLDIKLEKLKQEDKDKNNEYLFKEKQVATYLECRNSVFGKIKYYFKNKNGKFTKLKSNNSKLKKIEEDNKIEKDITNSVIEEKSVYTIEDLIKICIELDRINKKVEENKLDIKALEDKINIIDKKIKNATLFIQTIEEHKKSIFEFWKFSNKDLALGLNSAEEVKQLEKTKKISKTFNYEDDIEEFGMEVDNIQRAILSEKEKDSIYIATTDLINDINNVRKNNNINIDEFQKIKEKAMKKNTEGFDIFGNIKDNISKNLTLGNKKHRETLKNEYIILNMGLITTLEEYKKELQEKAQNIENAFNKMKAISDINIYVALTDKIDLTELKVFYINPEDAINAVNDNKKISLYKIKIKDGTNLIYNSNSIYYNNINSTLPIGMNVNKTVLFDMSKYKLALKKQKIFRLNKNNKDLYFCERIICGYEYEILGGENEDIIN